MTRLFIAAFIILATAGAATARPACDPRMGDAVAPDVKALNQLKTRPEIPSAQDINPAITMAAVVKPGNDVDRWNPTMAATLVGYVAKVGVGGVETVNCHARDAAHRDTHIDLVPKAADAGRADRHVIVEVTPQPRQAMAAQGSDWSTATLQTQLFQRCVKITGWMMFDKEHVGESTNTAPTNPQDWRATAWEIHPITAIELLPSCPGP